MDDMTCLNEMNRSVEDIGGMEAPLPLPARLCFALMRALWGSKPSEARAAMHAVLSAGTGPDGERQHGGAYLLASVAFERACEQLAVLEREQVPWWDKDDPMGCVDVVVAQQTVNARCALARSPDGSEPSARQLLDCQLWGVDTMDRVCVTMGRPMRNMMNKPGARALPMTDLVSHVLCMHACQAAHPDRGDRLLFCMAREMSPSPAMVKLVLGRRSPRHDMVVRRAMLAIAGVTEFAMLGTSQPVQGPRVHDFIAAETLLDVYQCAYDAKVRYVQGEGPGPNPLHWDQSHMLLQTALHNHEYVLALNEAARPFMAHTGVHYFHPSACELALSACVMLSGGGSALYARLRDNTLDEASLDWLIMMRDGTGAWHCNVRHASTWALRMGRNAEHAIEHGAPSSEAWLGHALRRHAWFVPVAMAVFMWRTDMVAERAVLDPDGVDAWGRGRSAHDPVPPPVHTLMGRAYATVAPGVQRRGLLFVRDLRKVYDMLNDAAAPAAPSADPRPMATSCTIRDYAWQLHAPPPPHHAPSLH